MNHTLLKVSQQTPVINDTTQAATLLRWVICGSVDDGKSTLIGRLLYEANLIYDDHLTALAADSKKSGTDAAFDFSLLLDGLMAEREQKITIDVAYRFFATAKRAFIVADAPGHTQYTRNMITAASTAAVAVVLVDARKGLVTQTKRHSMIAALLGIKHIVFVVNKMDRINYSENRFNHLCEEFRAYMDSLGITHIHTLPISALQGDNILQPSVHTPWYHGPSLLECLENIQVTTPVQQQAFRMIVQWVNRPHADFRGFSGQIASGVIAPGDRLMVLPSGQEARVERIVSFEGDLARAEAGHSITLTFQEAIDISRGDMLASANKPCPLADQFNADVFWMVEKPMTPGRHYYLKISASYVSCTIDKPDYTVDIDTLEKHYTRDLTYNQIGRCSLRLDRLVSYELYENNRTLGGFLIIDKSTQEILGIGVIRNGLQRALNIPYQKLAVNQSMRSAIKWQTARVLWLTGLSSAGKSTIANLLETALHARGHHTMLLDANNLRHGLNHTLGFSESDRIENIRRMAEVAKLMTEAGLITLVACIAPMAVDRAVAAMIIGKEHYHELFIDAPLAVAEARDVRGLYAKARSGEISHFTGISAAYEVPTNPDLHINTVILNPDEAVETILNWLINKKMIPA